MVAVSEASSAPPLLTVGRGVEYDIPTLSEVVKCADNSGLGSVG